MYDPRHLRGTFVALGSVVLAMSAISAMIGATIGRRPPGLPPSHSGTDVSTYVGAASRIAGVVREGRRNDRDPGAPLGVLLGASALQYGVDTTSLECDGMPGRWLSLPQNGAKLVDLRRTAQNLFRSGLKVDTLILAVSQGMLAESDDSTDDRLLPWGWQSALAQTVLRPLDEVFPNHDRINRDFQYVVLDARTRLFATWDLGYEALYEPDRTPWYVPRLNQDHGPRKPFDADNAGMRRLRRMGHFDADRYRDDGANPGALIATAAEARSLRIRVNVLLVPESSVIREAYPREADRCLAVTLRRAGLRAASDVIDLRSAFPDDVFQDIVHLDREGSRRLSQRLARILDRRRTARSTEGSARYDALAPASHLERPRTSRCVVPSA